MLQTMEDQATVLSREIIQAFDNLSGYHSGFRPAHAKGILLSGKFIPAPGGMALTRASHLHGAATPVSVRFSDFAGVPAIPDNDPDASPRGMAIRFHLGEHVHTDILAHSVDGFPGRTAEEFVAFLRAIAESAHATTSPTPIESFLSTHPAALQFVQAPKPLPTSFARECFYAVNAYRFINHIGAVQFGRYRIRPFAGPEYFNAAAAARTPANYLFDEMRERLAAGPVKMSIAVQIASAGDVVDDSTIHWPKLRPLVEFGTLELTAIVPDNEIEQRHIIFDPIPRLDGIEPSLDPLLEPRAASYLMSGRRRRRAG